MITFLLFMALTLLYLAALTWIGIENKRRDRDSKDS